MTTNKKTVDVERRALLAMKGACIDCTGELDDQRYSRCSNCRASRREAYAAARSTGRCTRCPQPVMGSGPLCAECLSAVQAARRGVCTFCKEPIEAGYACSPCRLKRNRKRREKRATTK